ncbi:MAG TPA: aminoglycoside phosphotransferase family protein [Acidimicrobiales bacterium]|nr:aminoglycoside phosphotransferase family protein [Acidimicrobiales bacterium]
MLLLLDETQTMSRRDDVTPDTPEVRLPGGKLTIVVRAGDTVRRPGKPWSKDVQRLLLHVRDRGFLLAPEPLGFDQEGREILGYIDGDTSASVAHWPGSLWSDGLLAEVGKAVAAYHRAVSDFVPDEGAHWQYRPRELRPGEVICHHDFAHYNAVFKGDRLLGMIDWDGAGPGTVLEEIAFLAWQWVPLGPPDFKAKIGCDPEIDEVARLRLLLDSYGYEHRAGLIDAVVERAEMSRAGIEEYAAAGDPAYVALRDEGYPRDIERILRYMGEVGRNLQAAIE